MVRKTLLTPEEIQEVEQKYLKLSLESNYLMLHLKDALDCIEELKEKQIPLVGHDFYWLNEDGTLEQDGILPGKGYNLDDPEWITKVLEKYAKDIRDELELHPNGEMVVELLISSRYPTVNSSAAVPEAIRISEEEANKQNNQLLIEMNARNQEINDRMVQINMKTPVE
jgi:hypothetical protein